jgi:alpha-tubulin suppressor-like RCC1 family protein
MAIKTDGTLWTWGRNNDGQLGDNTTTNRSSPVTTAGAGTTWCQVGAGYAHTMAIKTDGTLWTWGYNSCGQLGDNTTTPRSSPGITAGAGTIWCQTSAGSSHTAAIQSSFTEFEI